MTCIVGLVEAGRVYIGGDSAGVDHYSITAMAEDKVFSNGGFVFGFTTSFRMGQLLRYRFKPPHRDEGRDLMAYMVTDFIDAIRQTLKESGYAKKEGDRESGGTYLVGHKGRLFRIEDYYSIIESANGYDACGCGEEIARGSLYSTVGLLGEERVLQALRAADHHSAGVCAPFKVLCASER